jgi:CBS domain containing-hemolysin-like protein
VEEEPGIFSVPGRIDVEELEELFDLDLAEDDYNTVGGFITHNMGRLPQKGETVEIRGLRLEVMDVGQKRIRKLRVSRTGEKVVKND